MPRTRDVEAKPSDHRADYLSRLPDEILHIILSYLSLSEAATTTVLSRRWRHLFHYVPDLRLSSFYIRDISHPADGTSSSAAVDDDLSFDGVDRSHDALFDILRHRRARVKSLAVSSDGPRFRDILGLIPEKEVEELTIIKGYDGGHQAIPSAVFASRSIQKLELSRSVLTVPPRFDGLRDLRVLVLRNVEDCDGCLQRMLSQCQGIKSLVLDFLHTPLAVVINADNLLELKITTKSPFNFKIENAPRLVSVSLELNYYFSNFDYYDSNVGPNRLAEFLSGLDQIENLSVDFTVRYAQKALKDGLGLRSFSRCKMLGLKKMTLGLNYADKNLAFILLFLLQSSPNLQELTILVSCEPRRQEITNEGFWDTIFPSNCFRSSLRTVVFYLAPQLLRDYIHFPKYVLMKASNLREMIIRYNSHLEETSHIKQVKQELFCFLRASPDVVLELAPISLDQMPKMNTFFCSV